MKNISKILLLGLLCLLASEDADAKGFRGSRGMFRGGGFKTHSRSIPKSKIAPPKITPSKPKASISSQPKAPPVKEVHHHHTPAVSSGGGVMPFVTGAAIGHLLTKDSSEPAVKIAPGEPKENKEEEKKK